MSDYEQYQESCWREQYRQRVEETARRIFVYRVIDADLYISVDYDKAAGEAYAAAYAFEQEAERQRRMALPEPSPKQTV